MAAQNNSFIYQKLCESDLKFVPRGSEKGLKEFIGGKLPASDKKEVDGEFKKVLVLAGQKSKSQPKKQSRKSNKGLSATERRSLGLYRLPKKGLLYSSFLPLHSLWLGYMAELLNLESLEAGGWEPNLEEEPRQLQLQMRLCRADLHGAMLTVAGAACPSHRGLQGIVAMETKNTLQILGKDNRLRVIPKLGSSFSFRINDYLITLPGASIDSRPGERATKKLKNKLPLDF